MNISCLGPFKYRKSEFGWAFVPQLVQVINMIRKIQPRYLTVSHLPKMSFVPGYLILTEMIIRNSVYFIYERARSDCNIPLLYLMKSYLTVHTKKNLRINNIYFHHNILFFFKGRGTYFCSVCSAVFFCHIIEEQKLSTSQFHYNRIEVLGSQPVCFLC